MDKNMFWNIRSEKYDKLYWTRDSSYIDAILRAGNFGKSEIVLDVGSGTGIMARSIGPFVNHIIALDNSEAMLEKGKWDGFSFIKWDISERLFRDAVFDKVIARMVFHHIFDELHKVFVRCFDLLKDGGMLIVAEGIPPSDDVEIVEWYKDMFKYKEDRRVFSESELVRYFNETGYKNIRCHTHIMKDFDVINWLQNSGISKKNTDIILNMHYNASEKIKAAYNMRISESDCLIDTKNIIVTGNK